MVGRIKLEDMDCWTQEELETYRKMLDSIGYHLDIDINDLMENNDENN